MDGTPLLNEEPPPPPLLGIPGSVIVGVGVVGCVVSGIDISGGDVSEVDVDDSAPGSDMFGVGTLGVCACWSID